MVKVVLVCKFHLHLETLSEPGPNGGGLGYPGPGSGAAVLFWVAGGGGKSLYNTTPGEGEVQVDSHGANGARGQPPAP